MFQKTLEYGKQLKPDKMYILSAKHHLVPLTKELSPYDKTLKEMPKVEKEKWGEETAKQMKSHGLSFDKDKFIFLTGSDEWHCRETAFGVLLLNGLKQPDEQHPAIPHNLLPRELLASHRQTSPCLVQIHREYD